VKKPAVTRIVAMVYADVGRTYDEPTIDAWMDLLGDIEAEGDFVAPVRYLIRRRREEGRTDIISASEVAAVLKAGHRVPTGTPSRANSGGHLASCVCHGTGWVETSRERNEVARCPGANTDLGSLDFLRRRADDGHRRHQQDLERSRTRGATDDRVVGPPEDFGDRLLEAMEENRRRHEAALGPIPETNPAPDPEGPSEQEDRLFNPDPD
jgi:hypothetical protein